MLLKTRETSGLVLHVQGEQGYPVEQDPLDMFLSPACLKVASGMRTMWGSTFRFVLLIQSTGHGFVYAGLGIELTGVLWFTPFCLPLGHLPNILVSK
ncbi:MAG: hypothetical protein U0223_17955 [Nitrospira sp.]|nr:hypothetical protein [Nitrospira sp.]